MTNAVAHAVIVLLASATPVLAGPSLIGYTIVGGGDIDDVARGSKATYVATDNGDELKLSGSQFTLISRFDKVTLFACGKACGRFQPSLIAMIKTDAFEGERLVAGKGSALGHPLSEANGFTVIVETEVSSVSRDRYSSKVITFRDGKAAKVSMLLMDPLPGTDVLILARTVEVPDKTTGVSRTFTLYKLLVDGEDLYDITP